MEFRYQAFITEMKNDSLYPVDSRKCFLNAHLHHW